MNILYFHAGHDIVTYLWTISDYLPCRTTCCATRVFFLTRDYRQRRESRFSPRTPFFVILLLHPRRFSSASSAAVAAGAPMLEFLVEIVIAIQASSPGDPPLGVPPDRTQ